ncbi:hypothetical protein SK128_000153 [Halocaridina rubra]|uniref:Uncharacterized protein n=1 Tax=Halocaridina rubra TaxID=373956 RepID=A0AAN8X3G4_HALRR
MLINFIGTGNGYHYRCGDMHVLKKDEGKAVLIQKELPQAEKKTVENEGVPGKIFREGEERKRHVATKDCLENSSRKWEIHRLEKALMMREMEICRSWRRIKNCCSQTDRISKGGEKT